MLEQLPFITERCVIATILRVEGSAYKKEGSCILMGKAGHKSAC
mgnify:CR=1 FL=1